MNAPETALERLDDGHARESAPADVRSVAIGALDGVRVDLSGLFE